MADHDLKMAPYNKLEAKQKFIRPYIEKIISGKLAKPYDTLENGLINVLSEDAAAKYDFEPTTGEVTHEDNSGMSELEKLLKQSSITRLRQKMTPDEIAHRVVLDHSCPALVQVFQRWKCAGETWT